MKRLLTYLFIVLGLGLVVSNFAIADSSYKYSYNKKFVCIDSNNIDVIVEALDRETWLKRNT